VSVSIVNDLVDGDQDPLSGGQTGSGGAFCCWVVGLVRLVVCLLLYRINDTRSTVKLKHHSLFGAVAIAFGFVIRLMAGGQAVGGPPMS
jgi:hypothetical protein